MRIRLFLLAVLAGTSVLVASSAGSAMPADGGLPQAVCPAVMGALGSAQDVRVIVSLRAQPGATAARREAIGAAAGRVLAAVPSREFKVSHRYEATPALAGTATADGVRGLAAHPDVLNVALDIEVRADLAQAVPLIRADDAQTLLGVTGAGVTAAVMDTGIDTDHPLLAGSLTHQECYLVAAVCPAGPDVAEDDHGHGTRVAGIITSDGPPVGVAPSTAIEAFKMLDDAGDGLMSDVILAYDHIILSHPEVDVVNMSFSDGGTHAPGTCEDLIPAMTADIAFARSTLGITSFAASGNNLDKTGLAYPACISDVVSVGAVYDAGLGPFFCDFVTAADQVACFSQSDISLDLLAPGAAIDSTSIGGGMANGSGTSMSSPAAAGVAALLLESEPMLTPADVEARLKQTGTALLDDANGVTTCRVDAYEAVANEGGPVCASGGPPGGGSSVGGVAEAPEGWTAPGSAGSSGRSRAGTAASLAWAGGIVAAAGLLAVEIRRRRRL
ncbi:MAG: S8 family serine peptidase [Dehalococcoidia bacterium]